MIIEVALGVVLGVLILRSLPEILEFCVALGWLALILGTVLVALLVFGVAMYWLATNEDLARTLHELSAPLHVLDAPLTFIGMILPQLVMWSAIGFVVEQRTHLKGKEAYILGFILYFLVLITAVSVDFLLTRYGESNDSQQFLYLVPLLGLWVLLWIKVSRLVQARKNAPATPSQSEA